MTTLKKGSKGEEVKRLQRLLHLVPEDGIFGELTEEAVKKYQKNHWLLADGIVGERTWESLDPASSIVIKPAYISVHTTSLKNRAIKYIAVHYTAGTTSKKGAAISTRNVFLQRRASADFIVDDETIVQVNPDLKNRYCWAVGDNKNPYSGGGTRYGMATNKNTISIEICSNLKEGFSPDYPNHEGWYFTEAALKNATKLIRYLLATFNLEKHAVVRHYDISGKLCPGIVGWNDAMVYSNNGKETLKRNDSDQWKRFWAEI